MYCLSPLKVGPCRAMFPRWRYDAPSARCQLFTFGGCKQNNNNFLSEKQCESACSGVTGTYTHCTHILQYSTCSSTHSTSSSILSTSSSTHSVVVVHTVLVILMILVCHPQRRLKGVLCQLSVSTHNAPVLCNML